MTNLKNLLDYASMPRHLQLFVVLLGTTLTGNDFQVKLRVFHVLWAALEYGVPPCRIHRLITGDSWKWSSTDEDRLSVATMWTINVKSELDYYRKLQQEELQEVNAREAAQLLALERQAEYDTACIEPWNDKDILF